MGKRNLESASILGNAENSYTPGVNPPADAPASERPRRAAVLARKFARIRVGGRGSLWSVIAAVTAVAIGLLVRAFALPSPILSGDEYAYYASARTLPHVADYVSHDPYLQQVGDPLFVVIGKLFFKLTPFPELLMKLFNVLAFSTAVVLACLVMMALSRNRFPLYAPLLLALLPFSSYSAYFMPESLYTLLFMAVLATLVMIFPRKAALASCLAGCLVAGLMLTKPNGIAIFAAGLLTILSLSVAPRAMRLTWRRTLICSGLFIVSTYLAEVLLNALIMGSVSWSPLLFVGQFYVPVARSALDVSMYVPLLGKIAVNTIGHVASLFFLLAIPLAYLGGWLRSAFSSAASTHRPAPTVPIYLLVAFTLLATLISLAMTMELTTYVTGPNNPELLRLHGRYYAFVFLPILAAYFILQRRRLYSVSPPGGWRLWGMLGVAASFLMIGVQKVLIIYPVDYPELFSASLWDVGGVRTLAFTTMILGIIAYTIIAWRPKLHVLVYPAFLCIAFAVSQYRVAAWQFTRANEFGPLSAQGRALMTVMPEAERSRGVIISSDRYDRLAYFLFGFSSNAFVKVIPAGSQITDDELPPDIHWIMLLDRYYLQVPVRSSFSAGDVWLGWISPSLPAIHENVVPWNGSPLTFNFADGKNVSMLEDFNAGEHWGAWSAMDGAKIILPVIISGRIQIRMVGWVNPQSSGNQLSLQIGGSSFPVEISTVRGQICEIADIAAPTRIIRLVGIPAVRITPASEPQAVALARIDIRRADDPSSTACRPFVPLR